MNRRVTKETKMLRKARQKKGLSQQQVATLAGVHIRQYQRIEYGERPMGMGSINIEKAPPKRRSQNHIIKCYLFLFPVLPVPLTSSW